jgi:GT2 family glycosyltransferase
LEEIYLSEQLSPHSVDNADVCCVVTVFGDVKQEYILNWKNNFSNVIFVWNNLHECNIDLPDNFILVLNYNRDYIAGGLNAGINRAIELGYNFFILLDCDSLVIKTINFHTFLFNENTIYEFRSSSDMSNSNPINFITNGLLLNQHIIRKVGLFDTSYVMDLVDIEFCLRAYKIGYYFHKTDEIYFDHMLGYEKESSLYKTPNYPLSRYKFQFINLIKIIIDYPSLTFLMTRLILRRIKYFLRIILFEKNFYKQIFSSRHFE